MIKATISWNAKQIAKAVENGSMTFDNAIQRGHVWDTKRQSLFIDSLIRGFPVPPIYTIKTDIDAPETCKKGSKVFDCIDGKQRCEAMRAFRNNELVLTGLEPFTDAGGNEADLNGKTYNDLDEEMRDAFEGYTLTVYFFTEISDEEVADMMSRLNNGKPLTGIENARIKAKDLPAIINLASHALFTENMTEAAVKTYNNEDVVIKTALQLFGNQFELSTKNVKEAYEKFVFTADVRVQLAKIFDDAMSVVDIVKENAKKATVRKVLKKTNLVGLVWLVSQNLGGDYEKLADYVELFFSDRTSQCLALYRSRYNDAFTDGTNHSANVLARNAALAEGWKAYTDITNTAA